MYALFLLHLICLLEGICTVKPTSMGEVHNNVFKGLHAESKGPNNKKRTSSNFKIVSERNELFDNRKSSITNMNVDIDDWYKREFSSYILEILAMLRWSYFSYLKIYAKLSYCILLTYVIC